jgi:hypothetical protein
MVAARAFILAVAALFAVQVAHADPLPDTPFWQDYHEGYPLATPGENDVRAIAVDKSGRVWIATAEGVRFLRNGKWDSAPGLTTLGSTYALSPDPREGMWIATWNGVYHSTTSSLKHVAAGGNPITALRAEKMPDGDTLVLALGPTSAWRRSHGKWSTIPVQWHRGVRAVQAEGLDRLWVGTSSGLYRRGMDGRTAQFSKPDALLSGTIGGLTRLRDGSLCIASTGGLDFYGGSRRALSLSTRDGMPFRDARAVAEDPSSRLWIATGEGVVRYDHGAWSLRHSRRWLQSDDVRSVAVGPDGTAWVATSAGVDAIRRKRITLAEKADYFLKILRARHIRPPGLVGPAVLRKPGDLEGSFIEDDDNDGEHTGMYCATESIRYAVTHAPDARENAKAAFHALMVLQRATGTNHFIARSVLPVGTPPRHEVDRTFTREQAAETLRDDPREKVIEKRWIPTADGKWLWKRDASSDEVDGHLFGYATYYDLAADSAERKLVADQVDRIVGGIVDHGFVLQDIDGKATRWGNWSPASLNGDPTWHEERPGNSAEILAHLGIAYHVTGKKKYVAAARQLIERHGYLRNMLHTRYDTPSERTHINDELLSMVYPNLLSHPILPSLGTAGRNSMQLWHLSCEPDGIPFYNFAYNRFSGRQVNLRRAVETLREWPLDMVEWTVDNSHREDVVFDRTPGYEPGRLTRILPRSEMGICMWDQEPYKAVIGRGGDREDKPTDWLLAYWMGRYYGLVGTPVHGK